MKIENKKIIYFADPMLGGGCETLEEEFSHLALALKNRDIEVENVICTDTSPFQEQFDILIFDWGGMSIGNDLMGSFCRQILRHSEDNPNRLYVMASMFTERAMQDAQETLGKTPENVFLNFDDFADYVNKYGV